MNFLLFTSLLYIMINVILCSNFRRIAENDGEGKEAGDIDRRIDESEQTTPLITLTAGKVETNTTKFSQEQTQFTRQMDDVVLQQEKPVLLSTIPHTILNHVLFINSSGLFTNVTVVLTTTIPIATVSSDNDSIHRILSNNDSEKFWRDVRNDVSKIADNIFANNNEFPGEKLKISEENAEYIRRISSIFVGTPGGDEINNANNFTSASAHNETE